MKIYYENRKEIVGYYDTKMIRFCCHKLALDVFAGFYEVQVHNTKVIFNATRNKLNCCYHCGAKVSFYIWEEE